MFEKVYGCKRFTCLDIIELSYCRTLNYSFSHHIFCTFLDSTLGCKFRGLLLEFWKLNKYSDQSI